MLTTGMLQVNRIIKIGGWGGGVSVVHKNIQHDKRFKIYVTVVKTHLLHCRDNNKVGFMYVLLFAY